METGSAGRRQRRGRDIGAGQTAHLAALLRGVTFAVAGLAPLLFIWTWAQAGQASATQDIVRDLSPKLGIIEKISDVVAAPATVAQPWLPTPLLLGTALR